VSRRAGTRRFAPVGTLGWPGGDGRGTGELKWEGRGEHEHGRRLGKGVSICRLGNTEHVGVARETVSAFPSSIRLFGCSALGLSRFISVYFLSYNTIYSTSRALFIRSAEQPHMSCFYSTIPPS